MRLIGLAVTLTLSLFLAPSELRGSDPEGGQARRPTGLGGVLRRDALWPTPPSVISELV